MFGLMAQNKSITGTVTDEEGTPIAGATVVVEGTSIGTTTDAAGHYTLAAPSNGELNVSFIGYKEQTVAIAGKTVVNVALEESHTAIDDVVVIAFGQTTKEAFTGSAKVVKSDELIKTQSSNVTDALVGKVAGVQFTSASGRPGSGQTLFVRGLGSINAGTAPLYVVDGAPYDGDINNLNANDIESMTILKDAASNALYGARGANGVIMITTKRARSNDARVTFDAKWGINQKALQNYDIVRNPGEYYELHYRSLYNRYTLEDGLSPEQAHLKASNVLTSSQAGGLEYNVFTVPDGQTLIGSNGKLNPNAVLGRTVSYNGQDYYLYPDNWLDEIYKTSFRQEYNVSIAGGSDKSSFYASMGYLDNTGIIDGSYNDRLTARLRADYQVKKWLKVGGNLGYAHFNWKNGNRTGAGGGQGEGQSDGGNAFATALRMAPIYPLYIRDGNGKVMIDKYGFKMYDFGDGRNGGVKRTSGGNSNDLQDIQLNKIISEGNAFSAAGFADFQLYKGLKVTINGSVNVDETRSTDMLNPYYGQFAVSGGVIDKEHGREIAYNFQQLISYNETFGKHNIDLLAGHENYDLKSYDLYASKSRMFSPTNLELDGAVTVSNSMGSSVSEYNTEGYFVRAAYSFDDRFFVSGSYRRDASSKFHPDHRWGNFWSAGAAWILSKESWFKADWVDMLKLKASYGSQGNDGISSYLYEDYYQISDDGQGGITTLFARKGNPEITWETNTNLNVGLEFSFWNGRFSGGVDYFDRTTRDMLFSLPVPAEAGYSSYWTNVGDMANRGIEIELNADLIRTKKVVWDFTLNMTHYRNKLISLPDEYKGTLSADGTTMGIVQGNFFRTEGMPYSTFYIPTFAGVNEQGLSTWYYYYTDDEGNKVRDITSNYSVASQQGREFHGMATPDLYGGFSTSLRAYGFDLSLGFTYQIGGMAIDSGYQFFMNNPTGTSTGNNLHKDLWKAWTPENTDTNIPRFAYNDTNATSTSDRFLTNASYLNIQNITLGYTLPSHITRKFLVENLRLYVSCDNVWYWSCRQGMDPRQSITGGTNPFYYAPIRTISGGLSVTF